MFRPPFLLFAICLLAQATAAQNTAPQMPAQKPVPTANPAQTPLPQANPTPVSTQAPKFIPPRDPRLMPPRVQETTTPPEVSVPAPPQASPDAPLRPLTADDAARIALRLQPNISIARGGVETQRGRTRQIKSALLPQLTVTTGYTFVQNLTHAGRGGSLVGGTGTGIGTGTGTGTGGTTTGGTGTGTTGQTGNQGGATGGGTGTATQGNGGAGSTGTGTTGTGTGGTTIGGTTGGTGTGTGGTGTGTGNTGSTGGSGSTSSGNGGTSSSGNGGGTTGTGGTNTGSTGNTGTGGTNGSGGTTGGTGTSGGTTGSGTTTGTGTTGTTGTGTTGTGATGTTTGTTQMGSGGSGQTTPGATTPGQTGTGVTTTGNSGGGAIGNASGLIQGFVSEASLRQLIFDFNHTLDLVRQSSQLEKAATQNLSRVQSDTVLEVKQAFYLLVQDQQQVQVQVLEVENRQAQLDLARARFNVGLGLPIDIVNAQTAKAEANLSLSQARANAEQARIDLALLMGIDPRTPLQTAEAGEPPLTTDDVNALAQTALRLRPEVLQAQAQVRAYQYGVSAARSVNAPAVTGSANVYSRGDQFLPQETDLTVGVGLTWTPVDGGFRRGQVQEARGNLSIAQAQLNAAQLNVTSDVAMAYVNLRSADARVGLAIADAANAEEGVRIATGRYATGLGLFLDIINAQAFLLTARTNVVNTQNAVEQYRVALQHAIGSTVPPLR